MIWTGNNSDTSFHRRTVNAMLALLTLGLVAFVARRRWTAADLVAIGAVAAFALALIYSTAIKVFSTGGTGVAPSAWYATPLLVPAFAIVAAGLARLGRVGTLAGVTMIALWTYVIVATWWVKLIPLYTGYRIPHSRLLELCRWYASGSGSTAAIPAGDLALVMAGIATAAAITLGVRKIQEIL
jgi:hypothetical protein